jgi:hypothetical protein
MHWAQAYQVLARRGATAVVLVRRTLVQVLADLQTEHALASLVRYRLTLSPPRTNPRTTPSAPDLSLHKQTLPYKYLHEP